MDNDYHKVRISFDKRREVLWSTLVKYYFSKFIDLNANVLELGAGYCDFINNVKAKKKIAIDQWSDLKKYADSDVECIIGDIADLKDIENESIDFVFASNIFEHVSQEKLSKCLNELKKKLNDNGLLVILQPNYKFSYKDYAIAKIKNENLLRKITSKNIKSSIARCYTFVGKFIPLNSNFVIGNIISSILNKKSIILKNSKKVVRSYMHTDELDKIIIKKLCYKLSKKYGVNLETPKYTSNYEDIYLPNRLKKIPTISAKMTSYKSVVKTINELKQKMKLEFLKKIKTKNFVYNRYISSKIKVRSNKYLDKIYRK